MNSERENNNKISRKNAFQKSYKLICILMSEISIWSPINQQDFWACLLYRQGAEISVCYLYKRQPVHRSNQSIRFQTLHHGQDQRAVQGCQGQDQDLHKAWSSLVRRWQQLVRETEGETENKDIQDKHRYMKRKQSSACLPLWIVTLITLIILSGWCCYENIRVLEWLEKIT